MPALPIFIFIGSKGGAGTTTLCRELARAMRERHSVALVDADLTGSRSIAVLCEAVRSLDDERDATSLASVRTDGLTIVELADRYDAVYTLDERVVEKFVGDMGGFDEIIVDAPQPFAAAARPFVSRATRFFVVLEPTLLGVAGAQSMLADLKRFGVPATRIDLNLERTHGTRALVQRAEIERALESQARRPRFRSPRAATIQRRSLRSSATSRRFRSASRCRICSLPPAAVRSGQQPP